MNEKDNLNNQLFKHMKFNLIAFAIIFIIFGFFIFETVSRITYKSVDNELLNAIKEFQLIEVEYKENTNNPILDYYRNKFFNQRDYFLAKKINNPKIIYILRDENYKIINNDDLGRNYDDYFDELEFNENNLNKIYEINFNEEYYYRGIDLKIDSTNSDKERYVQLFINIDSEKNLLDSYMQIIIYAILFGIMMSIIASFILSKKTLTPIKEIVERQREFVENVSHELRTPLTIIQAQQELLLQEPNSKVIDKTEEISVTLDETKRLSKLTKDLLLLTRADSKTMIINKEEIEIDEFIKNLIKPYNELAVMQEKEILVNLNFNSVVNLDTNKIHQLLVILLDNALKYTESGDQITVSTFLKDNKCIIEVKDTGIGISDDGIKHVFDRFYREDKARNRETGGSGLGLAIAHSIVKAHNGTIKVYHNRPKGTCFIIKFPR